MELWIRSQNKHTLIKCNYITTLEKDVYGNTEYTIINEDELELGKYDSEKRLLEVLDEIQNFICIEIHENNLDYEKADLILKGRIVDSLCKIYQMPKE